jgi:hypothetical protein
MRTCNKICSHIDQKTARKKKSYSTGYQELASPSTEMPSVTELISSIKANSAANAFVSQAKKRKTEVQPESSNKKSRTT